MPLRIFSPSSHVRLLCVRDGLTEIIPLAKFWRQRFELSDYLGERFSIPRDRWNISLLRAIIKIYRD